MAKLNVFNLLTVDGYFAGKGGDISWHSVDAEFQDYAERNANSGNTLLFGRITYQLMAAFWPSEEARRRDPVVAEGMNNSPKIVFSRTLATADWANTRLVRENMLEEVRQLKRRGSNLTILGSGSIVAQLAQAGLIDEYQILVNPVVLGAGKGLFEGVETPIRLELIDTRTFGNGSVLLRYEPAA